MDSRRGSHLSPKAVPSEILVTKNMFSTVKSAYLDCFFCSTLTVFIRLNAADGGKTTDKRRPRMNSAFVLEDDKKKLGTTW